MASAGQRAVGLSVGAIACLAFVWWAAHGSSTAPASDVPGRGSSDPEVQSAPDDGEIGERSTQRSEATDARPDSEHASDDESGDEARARGAEASDAPTHHLHALWIEGGDPCAPLTDPPVPPGFDSVTAADVTVAWPPSVEIAEPTALAHVAAGLLEEAAIVVESERRGKLLVVLHATIEELRESTGAPQWASGLYNGAVHVVATPGRDFGVRVETLRHEIMHAELHVAAGCSPAWFNEGAAMLFAGRAPAHGWTRILRDRETVPFSSLSISSVADEKATEADVAYGEALAMVLYAMDGSPDGHLDAILQRLHTPTEDPRARAADLWRRIAPSVGEDDLRRWLAKRVLGTSNDADIDAVYAAGVCCWNARRISAYACRGDALRPGESTWFDDAYPGAVCTPYGR